MRQFLSFLALQCNLVLVAFASVQPSSGLRDSVSPAAAVDGSPSKHRSSQSTSSLSIPAAAAADYCAFGNQSYALDESWRPNLQPFGVMFCVRCKCLAVSLARSCVFPFHTVGKPPFLTSHFFSLPHNCFIGLNTKKRLV